MWSEDFDKRLQDAANNQDAAYNEKAWDNMELLLDKHLPQKKKRRRFIIWLLIPLLTGISLLLVFEKKWFESGQQPLTNQEGASSTNVSSTNTEQQSTTTNIQTPQPSDGETSTIDQSIIPGTEKQTTREQNITQQSNTSKAQNTNQDVSSPTVGKKVSITTKTGSRSVSKSVKQPSQPQGEIATNLDRPKSSVTEGRSIGIMPVPANPVPKPSSELIKLDNNLTGGVPDSISSQTETKKEDAKDADSIKTDVVATNKPTTKKKNRPGNNIGVQFSFGPDISSVEMGNPGQVTMQYGIGLSYDITKRFTVRTGFFVARKIYSADSVDYHPPYDIWSYYPNIQKIDANCLVYEIPVSLIYNFKPVRKHNWFVSAGISSYLMKSETYDYYYKNYLGQIQYRSRTIENENKHLFSILNISGGYQYRFNKKLSLMVEPYMKLPLDGVGFGRVKLNSAGALFSINYKPFLK